MKYLIVVSVCLVSLTYGKIDGIASDPEIRTGGKLHVLQSPANPGHPQNIGRDVADSLFYDMNWNGQFIMGPGDAMLTVFQMPADGYLMGVNVPVYEWGTGNQELTLSLHKTVYPLGGDSLPYPSDAVDGNGWIGGYDMDENGWLSIAGYEYTPGGTEGICEPGSFVGDQASDPLGLPDSIQFLSGQIWPDSSIAAVLNPGNNPAGFNNWIALADYGSEPFIPEDTWIGVLARFTGAGGGDDDFTGFYYASGYGYVDPPWVSLKFYNECGGTSGNGGWHIRHWIFNFQLAVLLTGDRGPYIHDWTNLTNTVSTDDRPVDVWITDDNPSGGAAGVAEASLFYQIDSLSGVVNEVPLALTAGNSEAGTWSGLVPGQPPGSFVYYWFEAVDVNGHVRSTAKSYYYIIQPLATTLLFLNMEFDFSIWPPFPSSTLYLGSDNVDIWAGGYGNITTELANYYQTIVEVSGGDPLFNTDSVLTSWYDPEKTLLIAGDEWLGLRYGWPGYETPIPEGDFAKTVLGIDTYYPDINYYASGDQNTASRLTVNSDDATVGPLADFLSDSLYLNYNPGYETGNANWLDGVDPVDGYNVAIMAFEGPLADPADPDPETTLYNTMIWKQTSAGAGVAFMSYDPLALNTAPSYYWIGAPSYGQLYLSPLQLAFNYFESLKIENAGPVPSQFSLAQNYPNPFNPVTTIKYELPEATHIRLVIIDLLGREAAVLVDGYQPPGVREIRFNAGCLASGMYFYRLTTDKKQITRKMVVLK